MVVKGDHGFDGQIMSKEAGILLKVAGYTKICNKLDYFPYS